MAPFFVSTRLTHNTYKLQALCTSMFLTRTIYWLCVLLCFWLVILRRFLYYVWIAPKMMQKASLLELFNHIRVTVIGDLK
jgi:hypothetical protein